LGDIYLKHIIWRIYYRKSYYDLLNFPNIGGFTSFVVFLD